MVKEVLVSRESRSNFRLWRFFGFIDYDLQQFAF